MHPSRDTLLKLSADHYYWLAQHLPARQDNLFRTYLWLASLAISLALMLIRFAINSSLYSVCFALLLSMVCSFFSLIICLGAMRGRDFDHPDLQAYSDMWDDHAQVAARYLTEQFWEVSRPLKAAQHKRAQKLRSTTWLLSISFFFLAWAGLFTLDQQTFTLNPQGGDVFMSDDQPAAEPKTPPPAPEKPVSDNGYGSHSENHSSDHWPSEPDIDKKE